MSRRAAITILLSSLVVFNLGMILISVGRYPALFLQPGARTLEVEPAFALVVYATAIFWCARSRGRSWRKVLPTALIFGLVTGILEIVNMGIEDGVPFSVHGPALQISFMLSIFTLWGIAGGRTAHILGSKRAGLLTAVLSAGICMLMGVTVGFIVQLFVVPPDPASVAMWTEFKRSGWTDPRAFGLANTLDEGFVNLTIAPIVAVIFGGIASLIAAALPPRSTPGEP